MYRKNGYIQVQQEAELYIFAVEPQTFILEQ